MTDFSKDFFKEIEELSKKVEKGELLEGNELETLFLASLLEEDGRDKK